MADDFKDIEQKVKVTIETNADSSAKQIDKLNDAVEKLDNSQEEVAKTTEDLNKTFEDVYGNLKPLTSRLGEAEDRLYELALAGKTTGDEYKGLLQIVSNYRKTQIATDKVVDASATTLGEKFGGAVTIAATSVSGITSGLALFGAESEETEKALLKVQAAMAFSDAVSKFATMGAEFTKVRLLVTSAFASMTVAKNADTIATEVNVGANEVATATEKKGIISKTALAVSTKLVTAAQWLWNTAILANPLVALVVGVVAAGAAIYKLTTFLIDNSKANDLASKKTEESTKAFEKQQKQAESSANSLKENNTHLFNLAKASGATSKELRLLSEKHADEQVAINKKNAEIARSSLLRERDTLAMLRNSGASDEVVEKQEELTKKMHDEFNKQNENLVSAYKNRVDVIKANAVEVRAEETQAQKDAEKRLNEHLKRVSDEKKRKEEEEKKRVEALLKDLRTTEESYRKSIEDLNDKTEEDKLKRQKKRDLELIENLRKQGVDVQELLRLNTKKYNILENELIAKREEEGKALDQKRIDDRRAFDEQYYAGIKEFADARNEEEIESVRAHKEALLEIDRELAERKIEEEGGTKEEVAEKKAQLNEYYRQQEVENTIAADNAILEHKKAVFDELASAQQDSVEIARILFEKNKGVQKGLLIAENAVGLAKVGINTATGISKAMSKGLPGIPEAIAVGASGALSAVKLIAATKKGLQALGGGGSAGGGGDVQQAPTGGQAPQVDFQNSSENQIGRTVANAQQELPPTRAYVVSSEVSNSQQIDRNRIEGNSF